MFRAWRSLLANGHKVARSHHRGEDAVQHYIRILPEDRVVVELEPRTDLPRGWPGIVYRLQVSHQ